MRLAELVDTSAAITATPARLEKLARLADLLRRAEREEVPIVVAWLSGRLRQGRIGIGWSVLQAAIDADAPPDEPTLFAEVEERAPLELRDVDAAFERLARVSGAGVATKRATVLADLFRRASPPERDFLARLVMGELRQGSLGGLMTDAVARASDVPLAAIRRAAMLTGDLEPVAVAALTGGAAGLESFALTPFRPVLPMLAQPAADLADALARLGTAALEYKLDGARVQIHRAGDEVRIYSRLLNDVTVAVPELVEAVRALPVRDAILDGETIALRPDGRPQTFQVTMRRFGRQLDVEEARGELPLALQLFDVLRLDGEDWIDRPARERWAILRERAPSLAVPQLVTADLAEARAFYDEALAHGHEGVMAKALDAPYEAGGRGFTWLKVKAAHTLDLVVLAAEWGHGRRAGLLSNIHLGARDAEHGGYVMLGKTFKGMTDEILAWQTAEFPKLAVREEGNVVHLRPEIVVEVDFNDVQESPRYPGGMALRLARVKAYRPDKTPADADTVETVRRILAGEGGRRKRPDAPSRDVSGPRGERRE